MDDPLKIHKDLLNKVLGELEMFYFVRSMEWKHHKNKHNKNNKNLTRITERAIITIPQGDNKFIKLNNFVYFYTPKELNISYYK